MGYLLSTLRPYFVKTVSPSSSIGSFRCFVATVASLTFSAGPLDGQVWDSKTEGS